MSVVSIPLEFTDEEVKIIMMVAVSTAHNAYYMTNGQLEYLKNLGVIRYEHESYKLTKLGEIVIEHVRPVSKFL